MSDLVTLDYEGIKRLARESGRKVDSLLVLSTSNDPFYAGAPAGREQGEWFAALWKQLISPTRN
jgi:hypothetical protein